MAHICRLYKGNDILSFTIYADDNEAYVNGLNTCTKTDVVSARKIYREHLDSGWSKDRPVLRDINVDMM